MLNSIPKVSILIPLYNSERFIEETLKSALNQTWPNKEIIVVDDGSSDNSFEIVKKYESAEVIVYRQENKGACATRNKAFELSTGDYIQYLDADDLLSANKIEDQLIMGSDEATVYSCSWVNFKDNPSQGNLIYQRIDKDYYRPIEWLIDSWNGKGMGPVSTWLTPRELIKDAGKWDESLKKNQDGDFFCRVLLQASKIKFSKTALFYYRQGNFKSISNMFNKEAMESLLISYVNYAHYTLPHYDSKIIRKALACNFAYFYFLNYPLNPGLLDRAEEECSKLGITKLPKISGAYFKFVASLIGTKNTVKIRSQLKGSYAK